VGSEHSDRNPLVVILPPEQEQRRIAGAEDVSLRFHPSAYLSWDSVHRYLVFQPSLSVSEPAPRAGLLSNVPAALVRPRARRTFCVAARDAAGNESQSCAAVRIT